jgi:hypothetical protein
MAKKKARPKRKVAKARVKTKRLPDMNEAVEVAIEDVRSQCEGMTDQQAVEFYGRVIDHCQSYVEVLEKEIENAAAD